MNIFSHLEGVLRFLEKVFFIVVPFVILILVLVVVHELGHYFFARINGVRVTDFSIGFGPKILSFKDRADTAWNIRCIPFGGFVKMLGDENVSSFSTEVNKNKFQQGDINSKHPFQKFLIAIGGPLFNFIFAFILFFSLNLYNGIVQIEPVISKIQKNSIAEKLKLKIGDKFISVNDKEIKDFYDIKRELALGSKNLHVVIERQEKDTKHIVFNFSLKDGETLGVLSEKIHHKKLSFEESIVYSFKKIHDICYTTIRGLKKIITRELSSSNISGPIEIAKQSENFFQKGLGSFIMFLALISVNLGMVNLFPIPLLDGGVAIVYLVEGIIRRELPSVFKKFLMYSGYIILIALTVFSFVNDIIRTFFK